MGTRAASAPRSGRSASVGKPGREFLDLDRNPAAADDDRALGDREVVGKDGNFIVLGSIELDDGAASETEHLVDWHGGGSKHHLDIERDLVECRHCALVGM